MEVETHSVKPDCSVVCSSKQICSYTSLQIAECFLLSGTFSEHFHPLLSGSKSPSKRQEPFFRTLGFVVVVVFKGSFWTVFGFGQY